MRRCHSKYDSNADSNKAASRIPVDVNILGPESHRTRFDRVGHVGLVEHANGGDFGAECNANTANTVVGNRGNLSGASCSMTSIISVTIGDEMDFARFLDRYF